jgi:peptidoglycan/LPS O-acetylase OafA/YrhL
VSASPRRNESLDVLRCIAILLVIGFHLPYYDLWGRLGWMGVDLFFVLSGFLISGLLFQEYKNTGSIRLKRFLSRRALKIYPSFYLLIILTTVLSVLYHSATLRTQTVVSAVFAQGYYTGTAHAILAHTWTVAVEEHFYLLLPLLLFLLIHRGHKQDPFRAIPILFAILVVVCLAFRWYTLPSTIDARMTHMRLDSLFAGVTLGYLYHFRRPIFNKLTGHYALALAFLGCIPAALLPQRNHTMQTFGLTALLLGFSFLVAWAVVRTPKSTIGRALSKAAAKIGFYSYSVYLWHPALLYVFIGINRPEHPFLIFWTYVASCIALGVTMAHLVEMPYLALRERISPSPESVSRLSSVSVDVVGSALLNARPEVSRRAPGLAQVSPDSPAV